MSLRLLLEIAARQVMPELQHKDSPYRDFIKKACSEIKASKDKVNFLSLSNSWLNNTKPLEGILGKFAHGNVVVSNKDVFECSVMVGEILGFYFARDMGE
jgi:hypothetical protein